MTFLHQIDPILFQSPEFSLFGANFQPWVVMVLPPGGFIVLGGWLLLFSALKRRKEMRLAAQGGSHGA